MLTNEKEHLSCSFVFHRFLSRRLSRDGAKASSADENPFARYERARPLEIGLLLPVRRRVVVAAEKLARPAALI